MFTPWSSLFFRLGGEHISLLGAVLRQTGVAPIERREQWGSQSVDLCPPSTPPPSGGSADGLRCFCGWRAAQNICLRTGELITACIFWEKVIFVVVFHTLAPAQALAGAFMWL